VTFLAVFALVAALVGLTVWSLNQAKNSHCPDCTAETGDQAQMIPVLFGFLFWCPRCNGLHRHRILQTELPHLSLRRRKNDADDEDE
jgi:hypothetical protein